MEDATRRSRRSVLGRGLAFVAGAIGVGAARRPEAAGAAVPAATELRLYGRHFHLDASSRRPGEVPTKGDRHTGYGELLDRRNGRPVGHFSAAHFTLESPFAPVAAASLELHTFSLEEGTIHGLGVATRGVEGHFAVLGGTGRYAGARGNYVARQRPRELGGDGTAEFNLTLAG